MATIDFAAYVTCEPNECKDCDLLRALIHRLERLTVTLKASLDDHGANFAPRLVAPCRCTVCVRIREALKEETDSVG